MLVLAIRTVIVYFFLLVGMRLMGKRQIGQLQLSELVTTLLLSELAALPIADPGIPLVFSIFPVALLLLFEFLLPCLTDKFPALKKLVDGVPGILINKGRLDERALSKMRISPDELLAELRQQGVGNLDDVEYALLEQSGRVSVILKTPKQPAAKEDLAGLGAAAPQEQGIVHPVVLSGRISDFNLTFLGKNRAWLRQRLRAGGCRLKEVFLFTVDDAGKETLLKSSGGGGNSASSPPPAPSPASPPAKKSKKSTKKRRKSK